MTIQSISIDRIRRDGGTQTRDHLETDTVESYAESMRGGAEFPPAVVFYDGKDYWLADGFHRVASAESIGLKEFPCTVKQGDRRAAILYSVGANATNGLRRTNADKRRAVAMLLSDEEWAGKSDRWIAEKCGVHNETVAATRSQVTESVSAGPRTGKDGRKQPAAKPRAASPAPEAPNAYVEIDRALTSATTRKAVDAAYTKLGAAESSGNVSPPEANELRARYREASNRVQPRVAERPSMSGANDAERPPTDDEIEVIEADDEEPVVINPDRGAGGAWGSLELSNAVVQLIGVTRDFRSRVDEMFGAVDGRFKDDFAKRAEDTILKTIEALMDRLPVDAKRAADNRARFQVVTGGK